MRYSLIYWEIRCSLEQSPIPFQGISANSAPRRDCLDHVIVLGERHLLHLLRCYASYHNRSRTHLSLNKDAPTRRPVHALGSIEARPGSENLTRPLVMTIATA